MNNLFIDFSFVVQSGIGNTANVGSMEEGTGCVGETVDLVGMDLVWRDLAGGDLVDVAEVGLVDKGVGD